MSDITRSDPFSSAPQSPKPAPLPTTDELKSQAARVAEDAKSSIQSLASETRDKVSKAIDDRKTAGAEQLSGLAQAAQKAAEHLEGQSPAVARVMRDAASSVDHFAGDLRNSDVREILETVTSFARRQPATFFAGSILLGFAFARFIKSELPAGTRMTSSSATRDATDGGYRDWSTTHSDTRPL